MNLFFKLFKWNWYWKSLKLLSSILLIGFFAVWITFWYSCLNDNFPSDLWSDYCYNIWDYEYNSTIKDNKFNFYNINLDWKLFTYSTYWIVWWENDWLHLTKQNYNSSNKINWTIDWFFICENYLPSISVNLSDDSNCIYHSWFNDFWMYIGTQNKYYFARNTSSSFFILRLCLYTDNYNSTFVCVEYNNYNWNSHSKFTQLWTTFLATSTVMETAVDNPFIYSGGGWWWNWLDSSWSVNDVLTWSYIYTNCTYQALIDYMESAWASKYLCYWWLDNFDLYNPNTVYNPIPWTWKTLAQILAYSNSWDTPLEWYNFWNWLRWWYVDMWSSYPAVYKTWFDIYYQYWWNSLEFDAVREYCAMIWLDIDFSNTVYRWQYFKKTCEYIQRNNIWIYDWSWNVVVWVNWGWIWNYTWVNLSWVVVESPVWYIQNFFNELKANFPSRSDLGGGALPVYIITFLCAVVLFRFLRH